MNDAFFMRLAIDEAWRYQLLTYPNPAVGCVVVKNGEILAVEAHKKAGEPHAEVLACKEAFLRLFAGSDRAKELEAVQDSALIHDFLLKYHGGVFEECEIFVTLEPCNHQGRTPPCAKLLAELKPKRVVVGSLDGGEKSGGGAQFLRSNNIYTENGICETECDTLLQPFRKWQSGSFVVFKMAMTLGGAVSGGTISCEESRKWVHALRDRLDLLVIGGNTVRIDRPTLDARLIGGRSPDILIISKEKEFDRSIPLFGVDGREVAVTDSFERLNSCGFAMIEGGYGMLESVKNRVDWYVFFVSSKLNGDGGRADMNLEFLHHGSSGTDVMIWARANQTKGG